MHSTTQAPRTNAQPVVNYDKLKPADQVTTFLVWKASVGYNGLTLKQKRSYLGAHMGVSINDALKKVSTILAHARKAGTAWPKYYTPTDAANIAPVSIYELLERAVARLESASADIAEVRRQLDQVAIAERMPETVQLAPELHPEPTN